MLLKATAAASTKSWKYVILRKNPGPFSTGGMGPVIFCYAGVGKQHLGSQQGERTVCHRARLLNSSLHAATQREFEVQSGRATASASNSSYTWEGSAEATPVLSLECWLGSSSVIIPLYRRRIPCSPT